MMKKGQKIFDSDLYNDVLAIRDEIKEIKGNIESTESMFKACKSNLFKYGRRVIALEHVLSLDEYKEINEDIEEDEKREKEFGH